MLRSGSALTVRMPLIDDGYVGHKSLRIVDLGNNRRRNIRRAGHAGSITIDDRLDVDGVFFSDGRGCSFERFFNERAGDAARQVRLPREKDIVLHL